MVIKDEYQIQYQLNNESNYDIIIKDSIKSHLLQPGDAFLFSGCDNPAFIVQFNITNVKENVKYYKEDE